MKRILLFCSVLFFTFLSCDSSSENPMDEGPMQTTDDDISQPDETAPVITISGVPDVIEANTEFNVQITDESDQVRTVLNLDGGEIFQSAQKNFVFELDPFEYTLGDKTLEIVATDGSGNESSQVLNFELKKLLFRYPMTRWNHNTTTLDNYIAVNKSNGELVEFRKIENPDETVEFFADDEFRDDEIIITQYLFTKGIDNFNLYYIASYKDIVPGTIFPTDEERSNLYQNQFRPPAADQTKSIFIEGSLISKGRGYGGYIYKFGLPDRYEYSFSYSNQERDGHFVYHFPEGGEAALDYKYLMINDVSQSNFSFSDFVQPTDFLELSIPVGLSYDLKINGYINKNSYEQYRFHEVFTQTHGDSNSTPFDDVVNIPIIKEYSFYQKDLTLQLDPETVLTTVQKGLKPFDIADLNVEKVNNEIVLQGEYSIYNFNMNNGETWGMDPENTPLFVWVFYGKEGGSVAIPYAGFQIPMELLDKLQDNAIVVDPMNNVIDNYLFSITNYEKKSFFYEAALFNYGSIRNEFGDRSSLTKSLK